MELEDKNKLAALLRSATARTVPEGEFWAELRGILGRTKEPVVELAFESATHFWGNFHRRSIFFLIPLKPDRGQLEQGKNELNLIADGLECGWSIEEIKQRLRDV